jgi:hypothetical protein
VDRVKDWAPLIAAALAAAAALTGYWMTYRAKRIEAKAESYAKALAAVEAYKQLPYRIRRRTSADSSTRAELGRLISDVQQEIAFYRRWLLLDSEKVGLAYDALVRRVYKVGSDLRREAWAENPAESDGAMTFKGTFEYRDQLEQRACLIAMQRELRTPQAN